MSQAPHITLQITFGPEFLTSFQTLIQNTLIVQPLSKLAAKVEPKPATKAEPKPAAKAEPKPAAKAEPKPADPFEDEAEKTYTRDDVLAALKEYRGVEGNDAAMAILTQHKATCMSDLKSDQYPSRHLVVGVPLAMFCIIVPDTSVTVVNVSI